LKLKYYLRGLGIGMIVTTLILMLSVQIHGGIMTDDKVVKRAKELGMVVPEYDTEMAGEAATETETDTAEPVSE
jgi:hypothetical protein